MKMQEQRQQALFTNPKGEKSSPSRIGGGKSNSTGNCMYPCTTLKSILFWHQKSYLENNIIVLNLLAKSFASFGAQRRNIWEKPRTLIILLHIVFIFIFCDVIVFFVLFSLCEDDIVSWLPDSKQQVPPGPEKKRNVYNGQDDPGMIECMNVWVNIEIFHTLYILASATIYTTTCD